MQISQISDEKPGMEHRVHEMTHVGRTGLDVPVPRPQKGRLVGTSILHNRSSAQKSPKKKLHAGHRQSKKNCMLHALSALILILATMK